MACQREGEALAMSRATVIPGFDPATYGLADTDPRESADVLGIWAGDAVP